MSFGNIVIYYDTECDFCRKWVYIIKRTLCLPKTKIIPGQSDAEIWEEIVQQRSWVISDASGTNHYAFDAMITLVAASPLFFILAPVMRIPFISKLGERYYRYVATHRRWL
jgi:predicted DCC family thiol-disulfide oxidoreductase YuxK